MKEWSRVILVIALIGVVIPSVSAINSNYNQTTVAQDNWNSTQEQRNPVGEINLELNQTEQINSFQLNLDAPFGITSSRSGDTFNLFVSGIEEGTSAGTYQGTYTITTSNETEEGNIEVEVAERIEGSYSFTQLREEMNTGDRRQLAEIELENTGNTPYTFNISSNSSLAFPSTSNVTVPEQETEELSLIGDIPTKTKKGNKTIQVGLTSTPEFSDLPTNKTLNLTVNDPVVPTISNLTIGENQNGKLESTLPVDISLVARDNTKLTEDTPVKGTIFRKEQVTVGQGNSTTTESRFVELEQFDFSRIGENKFTYTFENTNKPTEYRLDVEVTDEENNTEEYQEKFKINALDNINYSRTYTGTLAQAGQGTSTINNVFELETSSPVNITASTINYKNRNRSQGLNVELIPPTAQSGLTLNEGKPVSISQSGSYRLEVTGTRTGEYKVQLDIQPVESHVQTEPIEISGSFVNTQIPQTIEREWAGADYLRCSVDNLNRNNLDEARYNCELPFKITEIGNFEDNVFPMSSKVYDDTIAQKENKIQNLEDSLGTSQFWKNFFLALFILSWMFWAVVVVVYPRLLIFAR